MGIAPQEGELRLTFKINHPQQVGILPVGILIFKSGSNRTGYAHRQRITQKKKKRNTNGVLVRGNLVNLISLNATSHGCVKHRLAQVGENCID